MHGGGRAPLDAEPFLPEVTAVFLPVSASRVLEQHNSRVGGDRRQGQHHRGQDGTWAVADVVRVRFPIDRSGAGDAQHGHQPGYLVGHNVAV